MSLSNEQIKSLMEPILADDVKTREAYGSGTLSYIPGFHAIDEANRIFGFDGWSTEILSLNEVNRQHYIKPAYNSGDKEKPMVSVAFLSTLRLTVGAGDTKVVHEDTGFGDGVAGDTPSGLHSAIELASKEAITDAIKRCLRAFGNKFGNSLYEKDAPAPISKEEHTTNKVVDEPQLTALRGLIATRGVDDQWATAWLAGEGWHEPLEDLRQDWYKAVYAAVDAIGRAEREQETYIAKYDDGIKLMREAVSMNMLKGIFKEVWSRASAQKDKKRLTAAKKVYDTKKEELEK